MFDRYIDQRNKFSHISVSSHVTEQRAPTDESVRLLREMEEEARNRVFAIVPLEGNSFQGQVLVHSEPISGKTLIVLFDLNGQRMRVEYRPSYLQSEDEILISLRDKVAKAIANEVLLQSTPQNLIDFLRGG